MTDTGPLHDVRTRGVPRSPSPGAATPGPLEVDEVMPPGDAAFRSVGFTISTTGYAIGDRFAKLLAPLGLEPREFALLRAVSAMEGQSQQALGERLGIPASRMVAHIDALQARGLLDRRPNPEDRRAHAVHLTAAGREVLERALGVAIGHERALCAGLDGNEREQLLALLDKVGDALGVESGRAHSALRDE